MGYKSDTTTDVDYEAMHSPTEESRHISSSNNSGRSKFWAFGILIVIASGLMTLVQISNGLHTNVLEQRSMLKELRSKVDVLQDTNSQLLDRLKNDRLKTVKVRAFRIWNVVFRSGIENVSV
jgi:hypothetical protein